VCAWLQAPPWRPAGQQPPGGLGAGLAGLNEGPGFRVDVGLGHACTTRKRKTLPPPSNIQPKPCAPPPPHQLAALHHRCLAGCP
jgi:hypothetical protein